MLNDVETTLYEYNENDELVKSISRNGEITNEIEYTYSILLNKVEVKMEI